MSMCAVLQSYPGASDPFAQGTHDGLDFYYGAGKVRDDTTVTHVVAGSLTLSDDTTSYIEVTTAGVVSANTTGYTSGQIPLYTVVTASGAISTVTDDRCFFNVGGVNAPPSCCIKHTLTVSIPNNTITTFSFNTKIYDTDNIFDVAQPTKLTCKTAGKYLIIGQAEFASDASMQAGLRSIFVRLNGTTQILRNTLPAPTAPFGAVARINATTVYELSVGDYIEMQVHQTSSGALSVLPQSDYSPKFMMVKVG